MDKSRDAWRQGAGGFIQTPFDEPHRLQSPPDMNATATLIVMSHCDSDAIIVIAVESSCRVGQSSVGPSCQSAPFWPRVHCLILPSVPPLRAHGPAASTTTTTIGPDAPRALAGAYLETFLFCCLEANPPYRGKSSTTGRKPLHILLIRQGATLAHGRWRAASSSGFHCGPCPAGRGPCDGARASQERPPLSLLRMAGPSGPSCSRLSGLREPANPPAWESWRCGRVNGGSLLTPEGRDKGSWF